MRTQHEKNKEILIEEIEKYCSQPMTNAVAERLSICHGALKAMCMAEKGWQDSAARTSDARATRTPELDGDTEFEQIIMKIPVDTAHMTAVFNIFANHMEQLAIMNRRAYDNLIRKLREVSQE